MNSMKSWVTAACVLLCVVFDASAQQAADPDFHPVVAHPAHAAGAGPRVLVDRGHHNFHTASGRYKPFCELLAADGFAVAEREGAMTPETMPPTGEVLVIANALGADRMTDEAAGHSAFTDQECETIAGWVRRGGAILLIADHAPFGSAAESLAAALGVTMSKGWLLDVDPRNLAEQGKNPTFLRFSVENGLLGSHAISRGRDDSERIGTVITFTGQGLRGPAGSTALLKLSPTSRNVESRQKIREAAKGGEPAAAGERWDAQGLAFTLGAGRVVVMGEAALLTAQVTNVPAILAPDAPGKMGMNVPGSDDQQFALNIMRWLAGDLKD